ncbi:hypothetical protein U0070_026204, partial [Myodes glareolus]
RQGQTPTDFAHRNGETQKFQKTAPLLSSCSTVNTLSCIVGAMGSVWITMRKRESQKTLEQPMDLLFKIVRVTHPERKATFCLPMLGVKRHPSSPFYTTLGVTATGTVIDVNVSELGLVTQEGK